jgi:methionyl-tRNA formyltransferase
MTPESDSASRYSQYRYALFSNGAGFGREVLRSLIYLEYLPALLIVPEYPPAAQIRSSERDIVTAAKPQPLSQIAPALEVAYAAPSLQAQCASLLRRRGIDFILVACWPYLIDKVLIESANRAALNLHPSMLPDFRGADPIGAQLADDKQRFGVSLHLLNQRFDRGDIIARSHLAETTPKPDRKWVQQHCARLGSKLFIDALNSYDSGWMPSRQDD